MSIIAERYERKGYKGNDPAFDNLLDDILYQISTDMGEETEGQFERAEALADNAYMVLSQIQNEVPPDQQADVLAEYLRESGFSSHVVEQMLGIPRQEVDAALEAAGYDVYGDPLPTPEPTPEEMLGSMVGTETATFPEPSTTTTTAPDKSIFTETGKIIDETFRVLGLPSPTKVIGSPKGGTVVWGQSGGSPIIYTGTTPSGTQTGVTTGLPWLDAVVNRAIQTATGQAGVPDLGEISSVVIQEAAREALGLPAGADMGQITDAINKVGQATVAATTIAEEDTEGTQIGVDLGDYGQQTDTVSDEETLGQVVYGDDARVTETLEPELRQVISPAGDDSDPVRDLGGYEDDTRVTGTLPNVIRDVIIPEGGGGDDEPPVTTTGGGDTILPGVEDPTPRDVIPPDEPPVTTTDDGGGGGGTITLPPSLRGVREEPGDLVDIKYLYDFAKGLDQPFQATKEDEDIANLYLYAEGGEVTNEDAVDMLTRPRRPGEYGRTYFDYATPSGFTPTGRALGGGALNPNAIQIPEYNYTRTLKPEVGGPAGAAPMDAVSYTTAPSEDAEVDVDTLLEVVGLLGMEGLNLFAAGGMASLDGMGQGYYLGGPTDGMADLVPATIDGTQPAALSDGEFVIPADVVSHLGNGNSEAGAQQLYSMMDRVRTERTGTTKQGPEIDPTKMMPA